MLPTQIMKRRLRDVNTGLITRRPRCASFWMDAATTRMKMPTRSKRMRMKPIMIRMKKDNKTRISRMPTKPNSMREKATRSFDEEKYNFSASGQNNY